MKTIIKEVVLNQTLKGEYLGTRLRGIDDIYQYIIKCV